jgi:ribA/ribD-fused uncharacterized protein
VCDSIPKYVHNIANTVVIPYRGSYLLGVSNEIARNQALFASYKVILLHVGTNDVSHKHSTPASMLDRLKILVKKVRSLPLEPAVIVSSVLPRPKDLVKTKQKIIDYNETIRVWAKSELHVQYVKSYLPFIKDGVIRDEMFESDGLHPSSIGTELLRDYFCKVLTPYREKMSDWKRLVQSTGGCRGKSQIHGIPPRHPYRISGQGTRGFRQLGHHTRGPVKPKVRTFLVPDGAVSVQGETDPASNFWEECFWLRGICFVSGEQCYQYHKAIFHWDHEKAAQILGKVKPRPIKNIGGQILTHPNWQRDRYDFMWEMLQAKLCQSTAFAERLAATGQAPIYHTVQDHFWGSCFDGCGQNLFGFLLQQLRLKKWVGPASLM